MRKNCLALMLAALLAAPVWAGVVKKTKTNVTFKGFGNFSSSQTTKLTAEQERMDSVNDFKGKGVLGKLAGKAMMRSGEVGQIIDLPATTMYTLDHKKKEYTASPIKPLQEQLGEGGQKEKREEAEEAGKTEDSDIKVTRSEFKVTDTGETSNINNFECRKYIASWITEWENVKTGEKGSSNLETLTWTTAPTETLLKAQEEEMKFSREYMKKIGINAEQFQQDLLGANWMSMLDAFSRKPSSTKQDFSKFSDEMKKIKGYPIVIDGKLLMSGTKPAGEAEEEPKSGGGLMGGLAKKLLKKKKAPADESQGPEPALTYYIEVQEITLSDLGAGDFQVPPDYKKKG